MKLIVVTPAGREKYLGVLSHYVLKSSHVHEWHLWDNCRNEQDRAYLRQLASADSRIKIKTLPGANGKNDAIGRFFRFCDDPDAFYLRLDDDIVFLEDGFFENYMERVLTERGSALWYAPLIINNAICNTFIKYLSAVQIEGPLTCQAMCPFSWSHPTFPLAMHPILIEAVRTGRLGDFRVPDCEVKASRFSINAIGFFGSEIVELGDLFHPLGDEEEWFSAVLPVKLGRPGKVFGDLIAAHFSFYPQEKALLGTTILEDYYDLAGLPAPVYKKTVVRLKDRLRPWKKYRNGTPPKYTITLPKDRADPKR
ncbi:hypothetical protein [Mesorhizobium sp. CA4]|uniref:hypothetical protein n=1 Tax=Mesorhizobium sp. CA4 TaxID=588499 RepID=UPI001CD157CC|nr:hypothetical protein [Mesorhizobium sp. CA4]MBZ9822722.1 hypothetical protein [Mesorhizobium sp. CA4]